MALSGLNLYGGVGVGLGASARAAAVPWWQFDNVVAAYDAKNAADLATSYGNLANPGTHTITPGAIAPALVAGEGWYYDAQSSTRILYTNTLRLREGYTIAARIKPTYNGVNAIFGKYESGSQHRVFYEANTAFFQYGNNQRVVSIGNYTNRDMTLILSGATCYIDGVSQGDVPSTAYEYKANPNQATVLNRAGKAQNLIGYGRMFAAFSVTLTPTQVAELHARMMAQ